MTLFELTMTATAIILLFRCLYLEEIVQETQNHCVNKIVDMAKIYNESNNAIEFTKRFHDYMVALGCTEEGDRK